MQKIQIAIAASLGLALAGPALATDTTASGTQTQTQTRERDRVRSQVHHSITTQGDVSEHDAKDVDTDVSDHAAHAGYGPAISKAIHDALAESPPCKGQCLVERIHAINHAMDQGKSPDAAAKAASKHTAHASGKPSDPGAASMDHRRDAMQRDAAADRVHDRTMDRGQAGSHTMGAGAGHH